MRYIQKGILIIMGLLLSACVTNPSFVYLDPHPNIEPANIGGGRPVVIQVEDARPQGMQASYAAAKIDPSQNVENVFTTQLVRALTAQGFVPMASPAATNNILHAKILLVNYGTLSGVAATSTQAEVAMEITVTNSKGTFHKTYRASSYSDNYLVFTQVNASQQVNIAVNNMLENMLHDPSLLAFLVG